MKNNKAMEVSKMCEPAVNALLLAKAYAAVKREQVDAVSRRLLAESVYMVADENRTNDDHPERITDPRYDWMMGSEAFAGYYAKRNAILLETGIKPAAMPEEHCPALTAEYQKTKAEWVVLKTAWALIASDHPADGWEDLYGDNRDTFLDLVINLVVNRPGYVEP